MKDRHKTIKLLFVLPWLGSGGSERVVLDIAKGLDRKRFKSIVLAINGGPMLAQFQDAGIEVIVSDKKAGQGHFKLVAFIYKTIRREGIDIVLPHHITSLLYSFWGARVCVKTKLYFTEHTNEEISSLTFPYRICVTILLYLSNGCIAISKDIFSNYIRAFRVRESKTFYLPNGIDISRFEKTIDKTKKRKSLGINETDTVLGMIANFRVQKNHRNIIMAFAEVKKVIEDAVLVLAGSGPLEEDMKKLADEYGVFEKILFLGSVEDVTNLYHIFDIFCLPSLYEGLPLSILEAMACNIPVIATNVSGNSEVIQSGENGILVPSDNSRELAEGLIQLANDRKLRERVADRGYRTVERLYSYEKWICNYEKLFTG